MSAVNLLEVRFIIIMLLVIVHSRIKLYLKGVQINIFGFNKIETTG